MRHTNRDLRHTALVRRSLLLVGFLLTLAATSLHAQFYTDQAWDLKQTSSLYDERGYEKGKAIAVDGKLNVIESNASLGYSYPIADYAISGYPIRIDLDYASSVAFTAFCDYSVGPFKTGGGSPAQAWRQFGQNRPAWIIGVNGWAVQMLGQSFAFHSAPHKVTNDFSSGSTRTGFDDRDFLWMAEGYDYSNRMQSMYGASFEGGFPRQDFVDVIRLLRADGSVMELHNSKNALMGADVYFSDSLFTGYYHTNEVGSRTFAVVSLDYSRLPDYIDADSAHYVLPRVVRLYDGTGMEYVFREYILPYGAAEWRDVTQKYGGAIAGPTMFYLEEINSNAGQLLTFTRSRHNINFDFDSYGRPTGRDSTRGRALVTGFGETSITYDDGSISIQAMGRTTLVKFDEVLGSHDAAPTTGAITETGTGIPFTELGYKTPWTDGLAKEPIDGEQYQGFLGYVTQIIDPENRTTAFSYEPVRRSYKGFGFPRGGPDEAYSVNLENVRLKEIIEPDTRYEITYNTTPAISSGRSTPYAPADWIPIHASTSTNPTWEPWLLSNVVGTIEKYDCSGLIKTDEYQIIDWGGQKPDSTSRTVAVHAIIDDITGNKQWLKYTYGFHWLPDILPNLPRGRFTEALRITDSIPGYAKVTETTYDSLAPFMMAPRTVTETINGIPKTITSYSYQLDTARRFNNDPNLISHYGMEIGTKTELAGCACDTSLRSLVIPGKEITTKYLDFSESNVGLRWVQAWAFDKVKSFHNYDSVYRVVINGDTVDGSRNPYAPTWEESMYRPGIGVYERLDTVPLVTPPVYGLAAWKRTTDGHSGIIEQTAYTATDSLDTVPRGRIAATWKSGFVGLGDVRTTRPDSLFYRQVLGRWLVGGMKNANGATSTRFYLSHHASSALDDSNANTYWLSGLALDDRDSVHAVSLSDGDEFAISYEQPSAARSLVRKMSPVGLVVNDTLDNYYERTFYGLVAGSVDANGWYSRADHDKNGRLVTAWLPGDFGSGHLTDTSVVVGTLASAMTGYTVDTLVSDTVNCDPLHPNGPAVREVEQISGDMWASDPVIAPPQCYECGKAQKRKDGGDRTSLEATCTQPVPYQYTTKAIDVFHVPIMPEEASQVVGLDSAYLRLLVTSVSGSCVHLEVKIPQFAFTRTYVFHCTGIALDVGGDSSGGGGLEECGQVMTHPSPSGFVLKVDLSSIKDSLLANAVLGRSMTVTLGVTTAGAEVHFAGDYYDDYRPEMVMKGTFRSFDRHDDYTLAFRHIDDSLRAEMNAKVDDSRHTASRYAPSGTFAVRTTQKRYQFGADYRVDKTFQPIGNPTSPSRIDSTTGLFNGLGQVMHAIDQAGDTTSTDYDAAGRPIEVRNADGTRTRIAYYYGTDTTFGIPPMTSSARYTTGDFDTTVTYACHFVQAKVMTNEDGTKSVQYFDALDRLRRQVADSGGPGHLNLTTTFEYDGLGRPTRVVNPKGDVTSYSYAPLGTVRYKSQPDIGTVSYAYDDLGNLRFSESQEQADSNRLTFSEYDDLNRLTLVGEASVSPSAWEGGAGGENGFGGVASGDTSLHRLTDTLDPRWLHTASDASTLPVTYNTTAWLDGLVSVPTVAPLGNFSYSLCPLPADTMLGEITPPVAPFVRHPVTSYEPVIAPLAGLDDFENLKKYPHFGRMAIAYDEIPKSSGGIWGGFPSAELWDSLAPRKKVRNLKGRTAAIAYRDHGGEPYHYLVQSYDERGRVEALLRWTDNLGFDAVYYEYNAFNKITSVRVVDPLRQFQTWYGYDWNGRVDSIWTALGGSGSGLALSAPRYKAPLAEPTTADVVYSYTPTGQLATMEYPPVSVLVNYAYNHRKWLDSLVATASASPLFKEVLGYDPTGQIIGQRFQHDTSSEQREIYRYDSVHRLVRWVYGTDSASWGYDPVGNRTAQAERLPLVGLRTDAYTYGGLGVGGANRLADVITQDSLGVIKEVQEYRYDANGSRTERTSRASIAGPFLTEEHYLYSYREQLRQYIDGNPDSTNRLDWHYRYNPGGEREQKRLQYGPNGDENRNIYPWVYYLLGGTKEQRAVYHGQQTQGTLCGDSERAVYFYPWEYIAYGVQGASSLTIYPVTGEREYHIADHRASVRVSISSTGTTTTDYTPSGEAITGIPPRQGFDGKEQDRENRLVDLSARKFDPLTEGFSSVDPWWERYREWSPYAYCFANPMRITDPSGRGGGVVGEGEEDEGEENEPSALKEATQGLRSDPPLEENPVDPWALDAIKPDPHSLHDLNFGLRQLEYDNFQRNMYGGGPGQWVEVDEHMKPRARDYQEQVTGHRGEAYRVNGVDFDGYENGTLIEAKGPGYSGLMKDGKFRDGWKVIQGIEDQMNNQVRAANGTPIEWHVAEPEAMKAFEEMASRLNLQNHIRFVYDPPTSK